MRIEDVKYLAEVFEGEKIKVEKATLRDLEIVRRLKDEY